jgi:hypothetical protein
LAPVNNHLSVCAVVHGVLAAAQADNLELHIGAELVNVVI